MRFLYIRMELGGGEIDSCREIDQSACSSSGMTHLLTMCMRMP